MLYVIAQYAAQRTVRFDGYQIVFLDFQEYLIQALNTT